MLTGLATSAASGGDVFASILRDSSCSPLKLSTKSMPAGLGRLRPEKGFARLLENKCRNANTGRSPP